MFNRIMIIICNVIYVSISELNNECQASKIYSEFKIHCSVFKDFSPIHIISPSDGVLQCM